MEKMYSVSEAAKLVGVHPETLRRWDNDGKVKAIRLDSGQRRFTDKHIREMLNIPFEKKERKAVLYARVSSNGQKDDLKNQIELLEMFALGRGLIAETISEIGGGMNFDRPKFMRMIIDMINGEIDTIIVAHRDRLTRFGFELVENLCKTYDCELLVLNQEKLSPEQEVVEDLMTIIHTFSSRLYGLRKYKTIKDIISNEKGSKNS